jgi:hypothetical protein
MKPDDSEELRRFLKMLDNAEIETSDWEAQFIGSNLTREYFSAKQREIVMTLMEKYGKRIGYY